MEIQFEDRVAIVRMQAGRANAINAAFLDGLEALTERLSQQPPGAVVITGYDRYFSAGLDLSGLLGLEREGMRQFILRFSYAMLRLFSVARPVVAAINGHAIAGGCVIALQADYRMMADNNTSIGLNEVQLGVGLPAVVVESLRCQVPPAALLPICLEGRLLKPAGALNAGLVHEVVAPESLTEAAIARARSLAEIPDRAYAQVKFAIRRPVLEVMEHRLQQETDYWLDTWFSDAARARIQQAIERMADKTRAS